MNEVRTWWHCGVTMAVTAAVLVAFTGCASTELGGGGDGEVAGEYALILTRDGGEYGGTVWLEDATSGTLAVTEPITVPETPLTLEREGSVYRFAASYRVVENGCAGILRMEGVRESSGGFAGDAVLEDECVGEIPLRFTLMPR